MAALLQLGLISALPNAAVAADQAGIRVGALDINPVLQIGEAYNDNIVLAETNTESSWVTTIKPAVRLQLEHGANTFGLNYQLSQGVFHSSDDDYLDHTARANAHLDMTSRLQSDLWGGYRKAHDPRGSTFTGAPISFNTPDKYHQTDAGIKVGYGLRARVQVKGDYSNKRYDNHRSLTASRDLDRAGGGLLFTFPIMPKTRLALEARYKTFNYKVANLDSNEQYYFTGLDWEATAKTSGSLRLGYSRKRFDDLLLKDASKFSGELGMNWAPLTYSTFDISALYAPTETDGTGSYTQTTMGSVSWNHGWSSYLHHTAMVSYTDNQFRGVVTPRTDKTTVVSISVDYQLMRWLNIGAGYKYNNKNSNAANTSYRQNIWSLNLTGTP